MVTDTSILVKITKKKSTFILIRLLSHHFSKNQVKTTNMLDPLKYESVASYLTVSYFFLPRDPYH